MLINIIKYLFFSIIFSIISLFVFDNIILKYYVNTNKEVYIPDVRGLYKNNAIKKLNSMDLKVKITNIPFTTDNEVGKVIKMSPPTPVKIKTGRTIELSIPMEKKNIVVPNLIDKTLRNSIIVIKNKGLEIDTIMYEHFSEFKKDKITFQSPNSGSIVPAGSKITLMVSKGAPPDLFIVPDLINLSLNRAEKKIIQSGLRVGKIEYEYHPELLKKTVIDQSLTPGMSIGIPAEIDLIITSDD
tara:strand:+ start:2924 stop:3649 length:726 start_codon:yes stop_codon:yes gene_type:complete